MIPGEIPDSESDIGFRNPEEWADITFGESYSSTPSQVKDDATIASPAELVESEPALVPSPVELNEEALNTNEALESVVEPTQMEHSRRRRFNFKEWVAKEKKTHEMVYRKRISYFHGALSDSEDEDYGEFFNDKDALNDEAEEGDFGTESANEEPNYENPPSPETIEYNHPLRRPTRRPQLISDSESSDSDESESNSSDTSSVVMLYSKRLKTSIPASRTHDGVVESLQESLESSMEDSMPSFDYPLEAQEGRDHLDYMVPATTRHRNASTQIRITDIVHELGKNAPLALKVAARTAKRRTGNQVKPDTPRNKYFAGHNPEGMKVLRRWGNGKLGLEEDTNSQSGTSRPRPSRLSLNLKRSKPHGVAQSSFKTLFNHIRPQKKSKKRKRAPPPRFRNYSADMYHTTVLERPTPAQFPSTTQSTASNFTYNPAAKSSSYSSHHSDKHKSSTQQQKVFIKVRKSSPTRFFEPKLMPKSSFVGSELLNMLSIPMMWDYERSAFGTALDEANIVQVLSDVEHIYELCIENYVKNTTSSIYPEIYKYFLHGVAYLCDESQIVEPKFAELVLHKWIKLGKRMLQVTIKTNSSWSQTALYVVELVSLAALILGQRVKLLRPDSRRASQSRILAMWTIYYLQRDISKQVDAVHYNSPGRVVGVELAHIAGKLGVYKDLVPNVFPTGNIEANWHLLVLITAVHPPGAFTFGWDLVRILTSSETQTDELIRCSMEYSQKLIAEWNWPGNVDVITDFFKFYAQQKNYADPKGEKIWLPKFLLLSRFDGTYTPSNDFDLFLEILGLMLRKFSAEVIACRRIRSRVTPLSALSFPETSAISLSDLSNASHQYGVLIVLFRMLKPEIRPLISQFRDLVVLKNSHLAVRIKAVSAWEIVSHIVTEPMDAKECLEWMRVDILQSGENVPQSLLHASLKTSNKLTTLQTVPTELLVDLGLESKVEETRELAFRLQSMSSTPITLKYYDHFSKKDIARYARAILKDPQNFYTQLSDSTTDVALNICAEILKLNRSQIEVPEVSAVICELLAMPRIPPAGIELLKAARIIEFESLDIAQHRKAIRQYFGSSNSLISGISGWERILSQVSNNLNSMNEAEKVLYSPLVVDIRKLAFNDFPELSEHFTFNISENIISLENLQRNIEELVALIKARGLTQDFYKAESLYFEELTLSSYYFFAYKLKRLLDVSVDNARYDVMQIDDTTFSAEIIDAVDSFVDRDQQVAAYNAIVNHIFPMFVQLAFPQSSRTLHTILPILVRTVKRLMWKFPCTPEANSLYFTTKVSEFLQALLEEESDPKKFKAEFHELIIEFVGLSTLVVAELSNYSTEDGMVTKEVYCGVSDIVLMCESMKPLLRPGASHHTFLEPTFSSVNHNYVYSRRVKQITSALEDVLHIFPPIPQFKKPRPTLAALLKSINEILQITSPFVFRHTTEQADQLIEAKKEWMKVYSEVWREHLGHRTV